MSAVVVGIGQDRAGDDAVGLLVAREVARRGRVAREAADASALLPLLEEGRRVVLVDAVVGGGVPGEVRRIGIDAIGRGALPLSSHGLGVAEALALARTLYGAADVAVVGVFVEGWTPGSAVSPAVAAAVGPAADLAIALSGEQAELPDRGRGRRGVG